MKGELPRNNLRPVPDDFAAVAPLHNLTELRAIYGCGAGTVNRWCDLTRTDYRNRLPADQRKRGERARPGRENAVRRAEIDACLQCPFDKPHCGSCNRPALARKTAKAAKNVGLTFADGPAT